MVWHRVLCFLACVSCSCAFVEVPARVSARSSLHVARRITTTQATSVAAASSASSIQAAQEWDLQLFSPAKINLFLRILEKRPDNYHELASLFQTVGFGDTLYFSKLGDEAESDDFTCTAGPADASNLVVRALEIFREKTGSAQYFKVHLDKQIPAQAGMGGGSGDAATALFAANELCGCPATAEELILWSAALGSDITFFLSNGTCYCTGRGEILHPQPDMPPYNDVWLIKPAAGLSTPVVFKHLKYGLLSEEDPLKLLNSFKNGIQGATFVNDLELPAFKALPMLKEMKEEMVQAGFQTVLMSGSGSTLFALGRPTERLWPIEFVKKWNCFMWRTEFINRPSADQHLWYKQTQRYDPSSSSSSSASSSSSSSSSVVAAEER